MKKVIALVLVLVLFITVTPLAGAEKFFAYAQAFQAVAANSSWTVEQKMDVFYQEYVRIRSLAELQSNEGRQIWEDLVSSIVPAIVANHDWLIADRGGASKALASLLKTQLKAEAAAAKAFLKAKGEKFISVRDDWLDIVDALFSTYNIIEKRLGIEIPNGTEYSIPDWEWE